MLREQQRGSVPSVRKPESWPEAPIDLTYREGYMVSLRSSGDAATQAEVVERVEHGPGPVLASKVVPGSDYSPKALADHIGAIYAAARSRAHPVAESAG